MKESEIQRLILDYLEAERILAFRMNSGVMKASYGGKSRRVRFGVAGMADVLAFIQPDECDYPLSHQRVTWIEVKDEKGKQSDLQKSFQLQVESEGHRYILARSLEDVKQALGA
jgi:hypothetical protein